MNCKTCGSTLDDVTKKNCGACRAVANARKREQRRKRRSKQTPKPAKPKPAGPRKCARCSNLLADDYSKKTCSECLASVRARRTKTCSECQETVQRLRDGHCARCLAVCTKCLSGKPEGDHWMCAACRTQARERMARKRQARKQSGLCPGCGQESETKVCDACRKRAQQYYHNSKRKRMYQKANQLVFQAREDALRRGIPCTIGTWALCELLAKGDYDLDPHRD